MSKGREVRGRWSVESTGHVGRRAGRMQLVVFCSPREETLHICLSELAYHPHTFTEINLRVGMFPAFSMHKYMFPVVINYYSPVGII